MRKPWTEAEIKLLKKLYPSSKTNDLAERLDKALYVVAYKARCLGLKKEEGHLLWTKKEIGVLKQMFPNYRFSIEDIADRIGRGIKAVRTKANQIGLRRGRRPR